MCCDDGKFLEESHETTKRCLTDELRWLWNSVYETGLSVGGAKTGEPREKPPGTPASRTWLVSHVARAGLEPIGQILNMLETNVARMGWN